MLSPGQQVCISRDEVRPASGGGSGRAAVDGAASKLHPRKRRKQPANTIVRFGANGREVGRLPSSVTRWLAPLLDGLVVHVTGCCVDCPGPRINSNDQVMLQLSLHLKQSALSDDEYCSITADTVTPEQLARRAALVEMLSMLGDVQAQHDLEQAQSASAVASRPASALPVGDGDGNDPHGAAAAGATAVEAEDEKEDASIISKRIECLDAQLAEAEPSEALVTDLRGYQKQAFGWMRDREALAHRADASAGGSGKLAKRLHPAWRAQQFQESPPASWYWNDTSGAITTRFPSAMSEARGGVLADAMGLGKTVEVLSLIASVLPEKSFLNRGASQSAPCSDHAAAAAASGAKPGVKPGARPTGSMDLFVMKRRKRTPAAPRTVRATLVVGPMSLLSQWRDEILFHTTFKPSEVRMYYGTNKSGGLDMLTKAAVVITTYGTVAAEFKLWEEKAAPDRTPLFALRFFRVVLDEAHTIKNRLSLISKACCAIEADRRWALTGTPIQNALDDLYGLLKFLRVEPWCVYSHWNKSVASIWTQDPPAAMAALQGILRPLMLRRTKDTLDKNGKPIVTLPSSDVRVVYVEFGEAEQDFYDAIYTRSTTKFSEFAAAGTILSNYSHILLLLLRLRQSCDHPMITLRGARGVPAGDTTKGHGAAVRSPAAAEGTFHDIDSLIQRFLEHGDQSGDGGGLTASFAAEVASQLKETYLPSSQDAASPRKPALVLECPICLEEPLDPVLLPCAHVGCRECFSTVVEALSYCPVCRKPTTVLDVTPVPVPVPLGDTTSRTPAGGGGGGGARPTKQLEQMWRSSAKLDALVAEIKAMIAADASNKCIVFSQWVTMLDLVDRVLADNDVESVRLDGSLSQQQRVGVLGRFRADGSISVLTMSLRAGGVGLNLTAASHVILVDPWWNPAVEEQAIDRVHRIGQKKKVTVSRLVVRGTIEENILDLQARKKELATAAISKTDQRRQERIDDLRLLFGLGRSPARRESQ